MTLILGESAGVDAKISTAGYREDPLVAQSAAALLEELALLDLVTKFGIELSVASRSVHAAAACGAFRPRVTSSRLLSSRPIFRLWVSAPQIGMSR